jgi:hypothetical protein
VFIASSSLIRRLPLPARTSEARMTTQPPRLVLGVALALGACRDSKDSALRADSGGASDGYENDGGWCGDTVESCDWDGLGVCFAFINQSGVELWCADMAVAYGISTTSAANGCDAATQGTCEPLTGGDLGSLTATGFYGDAFSDDAEAACTEAGGTYAG